MSTTMRTIWLITLVFFVGGCSSYSVVYPPAGTDGPTPVGGWEETVKIGDKVRVTLDDDSQIKGKIKTLSTDSLIVENYIPYNENERIVISPEEVQVIEAEVGNGGETTLLVLGIVVGTIGLMAAAYGASGGTGSMGFESSK